MCCRYYFDNDTMEDVKVLTRRISPEEEKWWEQLENPNLTLESEQMNTCPMEIAQTSRHDVHPNDPALVIIGKNAGSGRNAGRNMGTDVGTYIGTESPASESSLSETPANLHAAVMRWGFVSQGRNPGKNLLINARAESALEKKTFSESTLRRRCIIPAAGFYEWDADKNKADFSSEDHTTMYMARIYDLCDNELRFSILTTAANASMAPVHDRMPLILKKEQIRSWLCEETKTTEYLKSRPEELICRRDYEQLTLFL